MKSRRGDQRFIRRLETEFSAEEKQHRGISSDLSSGGLFIRTNHAFAPGTILDIIIHLPDSVDVNLKGKVKRSMKTPGISVKNGMGIEILENDPKYINFVNKFMSGPEEERDRAEISKQKVTGRAVQVTSKEFSIVSCPSCGLKNKERTASLPFGLKCGKCGHTLTFKV